MHHMAQSCMLAWLQLPQAPKPEAATQTAAATSALAILQHPKNETSERIHQTWNKEQCKYPVSCRCKHICITCRLRGHKARDCENTPEDSTYMFVSKPKPRIDSTVPWTCRDNVTRPSHTYRYYIIVT